MIDPSHKDELKFQALAETALAATAGQSIEITAGKGLEAAVRYIGLAAGALILWDDKGEIKAKAVIANREEDKMVLLETENNLLAMLRQNFRLNYAYMELGGDPVNSLFTLPIELLNRQFGALIGLRRDKVRLHDFDEFLRALAAVMALAGAPDTAPGVSMNEIDKKVRSERNSAIVELAVAVNHEINNPLTALIGNLQLLRLKNQNLPEDVIQKLNIIEESASQISKVTARLMTAAEAPSVEYTGGMKMLDLSGRAPDEKKKDTPDSGVENKD
jgi:signal transduction histidine kinase